MSGFVLGVASLFGATPALATPPCARLSDADAVVLRPIDRQLWQVGVGLADPAGVPAPALWLVADDARLWLVGSGPSPAAGRALDCAVRQTLGRAVSDVVNTRADGWLTLGNTAFPGAQVWALGAVIDAMRRQCPNCSARMREQLGAHHGASLGPAAIRLPSHRIDRGPRDDAHEGQLGPFRWWSLPRAPGVPVLVLRHEGSGMLIAQGFVRPGGVPDLRDADLAALRRAWTVLRPFAAGGRVVGDSAVVGTLADIDAHLAYVGALEHAVRQALRRGDVEGPPLGALALPDHAARDGHAALHPLNLQRAWRALEAEVFR